MGFASACLELVQNRSWGTGSPHVARTPLLLSEPLDAAPFERASGTTEDAEESTDAGTADLEACVEADEASEVSLRNCSDLHDPLALAYLLLDPEINIRLVRGTF